MTNRDRPLTPDDCETIIEGDTYTDWKPLLDLIPKIEQQDDFTVDTRFDEMLEQGEIYLGEQRMHFLSHPSAKSKMAHHTLQALLFRPFCRVPSGALTLQRVVLLCPAGDVRCVLPWYL